MTKFCFLFQDIYLFTYLLTYLFIYLGPAFISCWGMTFSNEKILLASDFFPLYWSLVVFSWFHWNPTDLPSDESRLLLSRVSVWLFSMPTLIAHLLLYDRDLVIIPKVLLINHSFPGKILWYMMWSEMLLSCAFPESAFSCIDTTFGGFWQHTVDYTIFFLVATTEHFPIFTFSS